MGPNNEYQPTHPHWQADISGVQIYKQECFMQDKGWSERERPQISSNQITC